MSQLNKQAAFELIRANVSEYGYHIYLVAGKHALPRFAYTIGVSQSSGVELVLAGATFYSAKDVTRIINEMVANLRSQVNWLKASVQIESLGIFSLRTLDPSWVNALMLGAMDFYGTHDIQALQIVPDQDHWTIDTPDLSQPCNSATEPVWQWLNVPWKLPIPLESVATTNLAALRGERITEAARWEPDQWELFAGAGPDVPTEDIRVVPFGTLFAVDQSLLEVADLEIGQARWREATELEWHPWGRGS